MDEFAEVSKVLNHARSPLNLAGLWIEFVNVVAGQTGHRAIAVVVLELVRDPALNLLAGGWARK